MQCVHLCGKQALNGESTSLAHMPLQCGHSCLLVFQSCSTQQAKQYVTVVLTEAWYTLHKITMHSVLVGFIYCYFSITKVKIIPLTNLLEILLDLLVGSVRSLSKPHESAQSHHCALEREPGLQQFFNVVKLEPTLAVLV